MKKIKHTLLAGILMFFTTMPVLSVVPAYAQVSEQSKNAACEGIGGATGQGCDEEAGASVGQLVRTIITILSWIVGIISIFMMIIGGLKFITSNGNAQSISSARSTVIYALVGVAVAVVAQVLVRFVVNRVSTGDNPSSSVQACRDSLPRSEWGSCG